MIIIPGPVIAFFTFPGVIAHEAAHQLMCRLTNTAVLNVCYFRFGDPAGFVHHEHASTVQRSFLICTAPLLFNTLLGLILALPCSLAIAGKSTPGLHELFLGYLGFCITMHSIPSKGDAHNLMQAIRQPETPFLWKLIGWPVAALIVTASALSFFWFDAIYAGLVCFLCPDLAISLFAQDVDHHTDR